MSDTDEREIKEILRDIQEDIKGVPERGIDGIIPSLDKIEARQEDQETRLRQVEAFVDAVHKASSGSKIVIIIIGILASTIVSGISIWKYFTS